MKHSFRIIIGMLLLAIPLCLNAQVKPTQPQNSGTQTENPAEADRLQKEAERKEAEKREIELKKQAEKRCITQNMRKHGKIVYTRQLCVICQICSSLKKGFIIRCLNRMKRKNPDPVYYNIQ